MNKNYIHIRDTRQFNAFMVWLEKQGLHWLGGQAPTKYKPPFSSLGLIIRDHEVITFCTTPELKEFTPDSVNIETVAEYKQHYEEDMALASIIQDEDTPRTFRLLVDTPELKPGALVQEFSFGYRTKDSNFNKYPREDLELTYSPSVVENQPDYFEEVFPVTQLFMNKDELKEYQQFVIQKLRKNS